MARKDKEKAEQEPAPPSPESRSKRITPIEIQQKEFRLAFRGYNEREVDEFLDQLTEEVARLHADNRRLQEQVEFHRTEPLGAGAAVGVGAVPGGGQGYEREDAEETIRRARAEADRILVEARADGEQQAQRARAQAAQILAEAEAEARAAALSGGQGGLPEARSRDQSASRFLAREREFLQSLAGLIQRHAEAVKEDAKLARQAAPPPAGHTDAPPARYTDAPAASPDAPAAATVAPAAGPGSPDAPGSAVPAAEPPRVWSDPDANTSTDSTDADPDPNPGLVVEAEHGPVADADPDPPSGPGPGLASGADGPTAVADVSSPAESWSPATAGPGGSGSADGPRFAMGGGEEVGAGSQTRVMGGIGTTASEDPSEPRPSAPEREGQPEPSGAYLTSEPDQDEGEDRSLRELFWGED